MRSTYRPLPRDVEAGLLRAAADVHPREACGLVAGGRMVVLTNTVRGDQAVEAFAVDPAELRDRVGEVGGWGQVTHVWHSHPVREDGSGGDWRPSRVDVEAHPVGKTLTIVAAGAVYHWEHDD